MSGTGEMIWSWIFRAGFPLYLKSPRARLMFKLLLILPSSFMVPPAFKILYLSLSIFGLWSLLNALHFVLPPVALIIPIPRLSPTLAT